MAAFALTLRVFSTNAVARALRAAPNGHTPNKDASVRK
jgi:hypothetical protein